MSEEPLLLLWDIDGTLLSRAAAAHGEALERATAEAIGREVPKVTEIDPGGRTDREIVRVLAGHAGVEAEEFAPLADGVITRAVEIYGAIVEPDLSHCLIDGVLEAVVELDDQGLHVMALLTGNIDRVAALKLGSAGIAHHFDFASSAFGSDHEDRGQLPAIARHRAGSGGSPWPRERTVVIGDTPRDIACARADGCLVIAVATGPHSAEALTEADAVAEQAGELTGLIGSLAAA